MDPAYRVREFRADDWAAWSTVRIRSGEDPSITPQRLEASSRRFEQSRLPSRRYVVEEVRSGTGVGFASVYREPVDLEPAAGWIAGTVDPDHRRRGIGRQLFELSSAGAVELGFARVRARAADDLSGGVGFLRRRGFEVVGRSWESELDLARADFEGLSRRLEEMNEHGISITNWARERAHGTSAAEAVFELCATVSPEVPHPGGPAGFSRERFREWVIDNPAVPAEAFFLAKDGDRYVGMTYGNLVEGAPDAFHQQFTGTRREYRGRGIGTVLKLKLLEYARDHGIRRVRTVNDGRNVPILRVNRRLGFRRSVTWIYLERRTVPAPVRSPPGS